MDYAQRRAVLLLAGEAGVPINTSRRWLEGEAIKHRFNLSKIEAAAKRLGLARRAAELGKTPPPAAA